MNRTLAPFRRAKRQVERDLRRDPYLPYILGLAVLVMGFWFWHRVPNFATRDERWRVVDAMEVVGTLVESPEVSSIREGVEIWRAYGATLYVYGLVLLPLFSYAFLTGQLDVFTTVTSPWGDGLWAHWLETPAWVWTYGVLAARLVNVALAVGCVYLVYRIGTRMRDRATGRLAALFLTFTWGLVVLAHEAGEDVPALFFLLLTFLFAHRYVERGDRRDFLVGCAVGGIAIAFKLSAGVGVFFLGTAYLLRARQSGTTPREALLRPGMLAVGAFLGALAVWVGFPNALVGGVEVVVERFDRGTTTKGDPHGWLVEPSWWWILRGYLNGFGLPLFAGVVAGALASLARLRERSLEAAGVTMALVGVAVVLFVFSGWEYIRTHHLLPTFPLLVLLLAASARRLWEHRPAVGRPLVVGLLLVTAVYAGVGDLGYANQPRDQAVQWLETNGEPDDVVETYEGDPQDAAVPHGMDVSRPVNREATLAMPERCPEFIVLNYQTTLLYLAPDSHSDRARSLVDPEREAYYRALLAEDTYPYEVAERFGPTPRFLRTDEPRPAWWDLLRVGLYPRTIQYGDPQDFGVNQYTVVLERTGSCDPETSP